MLDKSNHSAPKPVLQMSYFRLQKDCRHLLIMVCCQLCVTGQSQNICKRSAVSIHRHWHLGYSLNWKRYSFFGMKILLSKMLLYIHLLWHLYDCLLYLRGFLPNNIFSSQPLCTFLWVLLKSQASYLPVNPWKLFCIIYCNIWLKCQSVPSHA